MAGFRTWLDLGRHVRKGENGIAILVPCVYGGQIREDQETGERVTTERRLVGFRVVHVFDVSQTAGDELPSPVTHLEGESAAELLARLELVAGELGFSVQRPEDFRGPVNGETSFELKQIRLNPDRSTDQQAKTLAHELGHVTAHHETVNYSAERGRCELEAESVAYVVLAHYGLDSAEYSFGYVARWSDAKAIRESAGTILEASGEILELLETLEVRLAELGVTRPKMETPGPTVDLSAELASVESAARAAQLSPASQIRGQILAHLTAAKGRTTL